MYVSDPEEVEYLEVKFEDDPEFYLRYADTGYAPHDNYIGLLWYRMVHGSWVVLPMSLCSNPLEDKYQQCLKQL